MPKLNEIIQIGECKEVLNMRSMLKIQPTFPTQTRKDKGCLGKQSLPMAKLNEQALTHVKVE
jgi:hypothetical protein